ncbi:hypothetical protein RWE15_03215 [Virgibacillus halophilus]|uniref:Uncharacterized protein n=1 Tax=Tigheibacillus halophilus TaxID=361280 RepID=A0ABU5C363_9BACI|nr:hypothetical protein [Virgibacillus halophilus]
MQTGERMQTNEEAVETTISTLVEKARTAMDQIYDYSQEQVDELVQAVAWAIYKPGNAEALAQMAVQDTGLGNYADKVTKKKTENHGDAA